MKKLKTLLLLTPKWFRCGRWRLLLRHIVLGGQPWKVILNICSFLLDVLFGGWAGGGFGGDWGLGGVGCRVGAGSEGVIVMFTNVFQYLLMSFNVLRCFNNLKFIFVYFNIYYGL